MPELPDVEGFRRVLAEHGRGRRVEHVEVLDAGALRNATPRELAGALEGRRFGEPERHGKWLLARTEGPTVLLHFGMTGSLLWCPAGTERDQHDRVVFGVSGGELRYRDMRKLQGLRLARDRVQVERILADQGPDALAIDRSEFDALLSGSRKKLKALLTDQTVLAGLGNLLADEILWRAGLHPRRPAGGLDEREVRGLYAAMRRVLRESVRAGHVPSGPSWLTRVRDEPGAPCPRCGTPLSRERLGGRTTVWCPRCQAEPR